MESGESQGASGGFKLVANAAHQVIEAYSFTVRGFVGDSALVLKVRVALRVVPSLRDVISATCQYCGMRSSLASALSSANSRKISDRGIR